MVPPVTSRRTNGHADGYFRADAHASAGKADWLPSSSVAWVPSLFEDAVLPCCFIHATASAPPATIAHPVVVRIETRL
jgi:hypothetical protein